MSEQTIMPKWGQISNYLHFYSVNLLLPLNWHPRLKLHFAADLTNQSMKMLHSKYWVGIRYNGQVKIMVISTQIVSW